MALEGAEQSASSLQIEKKRIELCNYKTTCHRVNKITDGRDEAQGRERPERRRTWSQWSRLVSALDPAAHDPSTEHQGAFTRQHRTQQGYQHAHAAALEWPHTTSSRSVLRTFLESWECADITRQKHNDLVVSALGIQPQGPRFESQVAPLFHWASCLHTLPPQFLSSKKL